MVTYANRYYHWEGFRCVLSSFRWIRLTYILERGMRFTFICCYLSFLPKVSYAFPSILTQNLLAIISSFLIHHSHPCDAQAVQSWRNVCKESSTCAVACPAIEWLQAAMLFHFSFFLIVYLSPPLLSSCQSAVTFYCCQWACLYHTPNVMLLMCCQLRNQIITTSETVFTISGGLSKGWRFWDMSSSSCFVCI